MGQNFFVLTSFSIKNFGWKPKLCSKYLWVKFENFESKRILGTKNFWVKKIWSKNYWVNKSTESKFEEEKNESKRMLGLKHFHYRNVWLNQMFMHNLSFNLKKMSRKQFKFSRLNFGSKNVWFPNFFTQKVCGLKTGTVDSTTNVTKTVATC